MGYHVSACRVTDVLEDAMDLSMDRAFVLDKSAQRRRLLLSMECGRVKRLSRNLLRWGQGALPPELPRN